MKMARDGSLGLSTMPGTSMGRGGVVGRCLAGAGEGRGGSGSVSFCAVPWPGCVQRG